jgi:hypothetical protein
MSLRLINLMDMATVNIDKVSFAIASPWRFTPSTRRAAEAERAFRSKRARA